MEQAARLLDRHGNVPEATTVGQRTVERRIDEYTAEDGVESYWEDEEETLQTLIEAHGDAA